ncbi:uncharacterized protein GGS22DRAFT_187755 [Annulohypoxylon maeteangense]|uniref:uncharacterized protein n=1 Tax=Annulohypoxylon maeteangense TaxID=1927788 RepID=UPI002008E891|nr:uncharacterized protein GGS22DRAFT_187755 [Annulohypoxylon maeteangense]KAI0885472.1 hypothetical protein GGS22DRAFT_187755 [Annulohypoxylon maeteangense]
MSGANTWLQRQRKSDLVEIAQQYGLKNFESLKKSELELALDDYLGANEQVFSLDPKLHPYYQNRYQKSMRIISPANDDVQERPRTVRRRATKAADEMPPPPIDSDDEPSTAVARTPARTPSRALSLASRIPLPATPADVAEAVDRSTIAVKARVATLYRESGITEATQATRESLSTVTSVLFAISVFELYFLRPEILADRYAFTIPAVAFLGTKDFPVFVPDMFLLLTSSFWSPALLWAFTSAILPSIAGYFINLSVSSHHGRVGRRSHAYDPVVDPLSFSITKALISYVVYNQGLTFGGWIDETSIARINTAIYGGYKGILTGTAITGILSIYDAVLKK